MCSVVLRLLSVCNVVFDSVSVLRVCVILSCNVTKVVFYTYMLPLCNVTRGVMTNCCAAVFV